MDPLLSVNPELYLRCLRPHDAESLFSLVDGDREHLRRWLPWVDATRSSEDSRRFLGVQYTAALRDQSIVFGIRYRGRLVGMIGFHGFDRVNRITSLGYWLGEAYCGKGIMRQCMLRCMEFAFEEQGMNRLYVRCAPGNDRSKRIPQALGFTHEGVQREAEWLYDHYVDLEVYSMLASEWKIRKPEES